MKSYKDKELLLSLVFLGLMAGFLGHGVEQIRYASTTNNDLNSAAAIMATVQNLTPSIPIPPLIKLGFVGDIMMDRGIKKTVTKNFDGDYAKLFEHADFLKTPDIMFANLEGPVSDLGSDAHNLYSFRMSPEVLPVLLRAGIDVVSFANNHVGDWKRAAFEDTIYRLHNKGILSCGAGITKAEAEAPAIINQDGFTVGFLCFSDVGPNDLAATDTSSGILLASDPQFDTIVKNAAKKVNALIVSFHFGVEYKTFHNIRQEELAKRAVDDGAVLIVGSHPHVPEDIDTYRGAPILYSLGNFIFDQNFSKETNSGLFVTATLVGKSVSDVVSHNVVFDKNFVPSLKE